MVAAVSWERYLVICFRSVSSTNPFYYTVCVAVFSFAVNGPRFLEFERWYSAEDPTTNNDTGIRNESAIFNITSAAQKDDGLFSLLYNTSKMGENSSWMLLMSLHEIALILFCCLIIVFCNVMVWIEVSNSSQITKHRYCCQYFCTPYLP